MLSKNYSWWERLLKIPFRIGLDLVSAFKSLFSGNRQFYTAIIRAHFAYLGWLFSSKKQSRFPIKRTGHPSGIYRGNVVWDYFVRKKKTFSEITRPKKWFFQFKPYFCRATEWYATRRTSKSGKERLYPQLGFLFTIFISRSGIYHSRLRVGWLLWTVYDEV